MPCGLRGQSVGLSLSPCAPALDHLAVLIELDHDGRGLAAGAHRRLLLLVELFLGQGLRQVGDPDVVLAVDEHAGDRAHDPVIGELLRPGGIDRESRYAGGNLLLGADGRSRHDQDDGRDNQRQKGNGTER